MSELDEVRSDGLTDEDEDLYETPSQPPKKPPSLLNFYIEENRSRIIEENNFSVQEANSRLRQIFREELGKEEKQKWKRKYKLLTKKFNKLLELYENANPSFNANEFYEQKNNNKNDDDNNGNKNYKNKKNKKNKGYNLGYQKNFVMQEFDSDVDRNGNNNNGNGIRKRKRSRNTNNDMDTDKLLDDISKPITSKKRKRNEKLIIEKDEIAKMKEFVEKMKIAVRNDWTSNLLKKPTLNCYRLLKDVVNELSKKLLHQYFLDDCYILDAIRDWIHPLPDGSLPAPKIRHEMYRILINMEIHKFDDCNNYLESCEERSIDESFTNIKDINDKFKINFKLKGICKTLMNLWSDKNETTENKKLLRKIIDKLIRKLTPHSNMSYSELREENIENKEVFTQIMKRNKLDKIRRKMINERNLGLKNKKRATIPSKPSFDFIFNPSSNIDDNKNNNDNNNNNDKNKKYSKYSNVESKFKKLKKRMTGNQAYKPSVTGKRH